jgi:hypothetical protein
VSDEMEPAGPAWRALSPAEKQRVFSEWVARREAELAEVYGPVRDDELGLSKARVPIAGEVTGRLRADGTIEPVTRAPGAPTGVAPERHRDDPRRHRDRPERP